MKSKIILIVLFFRICISSTCFADEKQPDLNSEEAAENYIDDQLDKININQLEKYLKEEEVFYDLDLKVFVKNLIKGDAQISDLINIYFLLFHQLQLLHIHVEIYLKSIQI